MQRSAESRLKEMMIDDINEEADDELRSESQIKLKWYLINAEGTFCKIWNQLVTVSIMISLILTPYILVFSTVYQYCPGTYEIPNG